jgi:serine protease Do
VRLFLRIVAIVVVVIAIASNVGLAGAIWLTREPAAKPLTADRIAKASKPAVVLVQANYTVGASLTSMIISDARYNEVVYRIQVMWRNGQVRTNAQAFQAAINLVVGNPAHYYSPGAADTGVFNLVSTGSGFFVTEDGYLVTAAHVVSADQADIRSQAIASYDDPAQVIQDDKDLADGLLGELGLQGKGIALNSSQLSKLHTFWLSWINRYLTIDKVDVKYYLGTGTVETGDRLAGSGVRASVVSIDPTSTGHDIAIMKASMSGVPTLGLASGQPRMGQWTYVIGYPRQGYLDEAVPLDQTIPATLTSGTVQGEDQHASGWTAWNTTAALTHGDSGGPVLDSAGGVLGIVSYSKVDSKGTPVVVGGFFVPSQYVAADLASASITPTPAAESLTTKYYRALAQGDIQRYRPELLMLQDIQSRSPFDAYVTDEVIATQSQVLAGNDRTPPDFVTYVPWAGVASLMAVALSLNVLVGLSLTRRPKPMLAQAVAPVAEPQLLPVAPSSS